MNHLKDQKSPYLKLHADNPIDWYPWGQEAFERARKEDKPIFLSIGYFSCHWCHVMERESFRDEEVAEVLNRVFINIKVDREERPDVDRKFMTYCMLISGNCGWPLNVLLTPSGKPFGIFTYLPKDMLIEMALRVERMWKNDKKTVFGMANRAENIFNRFKNLKLNGFPSRKVVDNIFHSLVSDYDEKFGGFGNEPKFPIPHSITFLLRYYLLTKNQKALEMAKNTLILMRKGGIYDHIGFGFYRYSTDRFWKVPHFEKMLYDQALLLLAYSEAYNITKHPLFRKTSEEIAEFLITDMRSKEGAFYTSISADYEGEEGGYYTWHYDDLRKILREDELNFLKECYGISEDGNWHNKNILYAIGCKDFQKSLKTFEPIRRKLLNFRKLKGSPPMDDKILTDWNGLVIGALSYTGRILKRKDYISVAKNAADFILKNFRREHLMHTYNIDATLEDYAYLSFGLLNLYYSTGKSKYLRICLSLVDEAIDRFWSEDKKSFISDKTSELADMYDGALPSGNSVMLLVMEHLNTISERYERYLEDLRGTLAGFAEKYPSGATFTGIALLYSIGPSYEIVVISNKDAEEEPMYSIIMEKPIPNAIYIIANPKDRWIMNLPLLKGKTLKNGKTTVYICKGRVCKYPINDINALQKELNELP